MGRKKISSATVKPNRSRATPMTGQIILNSIVRNKEAKTKHTMSICFETDLKELLEDLSEEHEMTVSFIVNEILKKVIL